MRLQGEEWEFYDLKRDPNEMKSIYNDPAQEKRIAGMKKELHRLRKIYKVPIGHSLRKHE